jgi:RNA polymerase sigma-70 factor (ECF subfamily)
VLNADDLYVHQPALLRYAIFHLNNAGAAEDAVQEAILAALEKPESFHGQASLKTWLMGILKYKVLDVLRQQYRDPQLIAPQLDEENDRSDMDGLFDQTGHWGSDAPRAWAKPDASLENGQFWRVYEECARKMPRRTAMVFAMREVMELEITDICQQLEISATNCSVLLYRARMSLRLCLDKNWFGESAC